jgi:hypothetical protein
MASVDYRPGSTTSSSLGGMSGQGGHSGDGSRPPNRGSRGQDSRGHYHNQVRKVLWLVYSC